jgi:hypothetical protein
MTPDPNQLVENDMKLQPIRKQKIPGRNAKCQCSSGKKAKKCCLEKLKAFVALPPAIREQVVASQILSRPMELGVVPEPST